MAFTKETARQAGAKSKPGTHIRTKQWSILQDTILNKHTKRFNRVLDELPDDEFAKLFKDILVFFKPRITHNINENENVNIEQFSEQELDLLIERIKNESQAESQID